MDIRIYTDFESEDHVFMESSSLIHAYEHAIHLGNEKVANALKSLFCKDMEKSRIEKSSFIYTFLKSCPNVKLDDINFQMVKEAYLIARYQNNKTVLRYLGKILGHFEQYVLEKRELEGLAQELISLPEEVRNYVLKHHDVLFYEEDLRYKARTNSPKSTPKSIQTRSYLEIGLDEKTYKKSA